jgi:hypothetical protein
MVRRGKDLLQKRGRLSTAETLNDPVRSEALSKGVVREGFTTNGRRSRRTTNGKLWEPATNLASQNAGIKKPDLKAGFS